MNTTDERTARLRKNWRKAVKNFRKKNPVRYKEIQKKYKSNLNKGYQNYTVAKSRFKSYVRNYATLEELKLIRAELEKQKKI